MRVYALLPQRSAHTGARKVQGWRLKFIASGKTAGQAVAGALAMKLIPRTQIESFPSALADFNTRFNHFLREWEKGWDGDTPFHSGFLTHLPVDLIEAENAFLVNLEIPGLEEKDIHVQLMGDHLIVSGERTLAGEIQGAQFLSQECRYGAFKRTIPLPMGVNPELKKIEATYRRGMLTIRIPKAAPTPTFEIPIRAE